MIYSMGNRIPNNFRLLDGEIFLNILRFFQICEINTALTVVDESKQLDCECPESYGSM
jgi:hypothetical protein